MRIPRIHTAHPLEPGAEIELEEGPSRHLTKALRMKTGDALFLFDGRGHEYHATISATGRQVRAAIGGATQRDVESPLAVTLGIGMSRGDRMDLVIQKACELGAASIAPLFTARSELKLDTARLEKKRHHWQQVAVSACEQCGRNRIPPVAAPAPLSQWAQRTAAPCRLILHPGGACLDVDKAPLPAQVALLVGPEGGFSDTEVNFAREAGFKVWGLGPRTLRTETAPLAAMAVLQSYWGDFNQ